MNELLPRFLLFVHSLIDEPLRSRWLKIAEAKLIRWNAIDPYDAFVGRESVKKYAHDFKGETISDIFHIYKIEKYREQPVVVASVGHGAKGLYESSLTEALTGNAAPLEGFVLFDARSLVFCFGHHGDVWTLSDH